MSDDKETVPTITEDYVVNFFDNILKLYERRYINEFILSRVTHDNTEFDHVKIMEQTKNKINELSELINNENYEDGYNKAVELTEVFLYLGVSCELSSVFTQLKVDPINSHSSIKDHNIKRTKTSTAHKANQLARKQLEPHLKILSQRKKEKNNNEPDTYSKSLHNLTQKQLEPHMRIINQWEKKK